MAASIPGNYHQGNKGVIPASSDWGSSVRRVMREFLFAWEFWIPPILALLAIGCWIWIANHNQDLLRQNQIDKSALMQIEHTDRKIQALADSVGRIEAEVKKNKAEVIRLKEMGH